MKFKQIVIWGHKLGTHTHSYVHYAFVRAFKSLGYNTLWLDNSDDISNLNLDDSLVLTEGQVDQNLPKISKSCKYILHNVDGAKYTEIPEINKLNLQFFHKEVAFRGLNKINDYTFYGGNVIHIAWATDLLPHEIDLNSANNELSNRECLWIGSYDDSESQFQNGKNLDPYFNECKKHNIKVRKINPWTNPCSPEENRKLVNKAYLAPAIQGWWQVSDSYIPCRIFKNISYGHLGITNNEYVNQIFDNKLIYAYDSIELFHKSIEAKNNPNTINNIKFLMNEVKEKHTYINRIEVILKALEERQ